MPTGRVKSYEPHNGYGFIIPDDGGDDVFVHAKAVERAGIWVLCVGQRLSYELRPRKRGGKCSAENLKAIDGENCQMSDKTEMPMNTEREGL
jgi:cold shock protein